ncbi:hypothetical protein [Salidesulfovibrio onnuriiensis]|uniref:hypothetical protein n=1 Tax=Salidesulfovibrio onnuriiensis TaxID=2583823 RepID=UPI00164FDA08|nr:hypothetical protein [Salidesulfovibrio onnuriiensis]
MHTNIYELERLIRESVEQGTHGHRPLPAPSPAERTLKRILRILSLALLFFALGRFTA